MKDFKKLKIWVKGMDISKEAYQLAESLPQGENYVLRNQLLRAATSIPSNIAEGASRKSPKEFLRFLEITLGSAFELETQTRILSEVHNLNSKANHLLEMVDEEQKMIMPFMNSVNQQTQNS